jgi:micrococcal nuclease
MGPRGSGGSRVGWAIGLAIAIVIAVSVVSAGEDDPGPGERPPAARGGASADPPKRDGGEPRNRRDDSRTHPRDRDTREDDRPPKRPKREPSAGEPAGVPDQARRTTVVSVTDGDTVELAGLGPSRLIGVDTPEVYFGEECYGEEASSFASRLMAPGEAVYYLHGVEAEDQYGRDLVYLWLLGGTFVNAALVKEGYAAPLTIPPNVEYAGLFRRLAAEARRNDRGLWSPRTCAGNLDEPVGEAGGAGGRPGGGAAAGVASGGGGGGCEPGYSPCVPTYPPDVDCADLDGPVAVTGSDPHGLDGDGDGRGCE